MLNYELLITNWGLRDSGISGDTGCCFNRRSRRKSVGPAHRRSTPPFFGARLYVNRHVGVQVEAAEYDRLGPESRAKWNGQILGLNYLRPRFNSSAIAKVVKDATDKFIEANVDLIENDQEPCAKPDAPFGCRWGDVCGK